MKELKKYIPVLIIAIAVIAAFYFLCLKPKQDKKKAEQAAAQAANDAAIVSGAGYNNSAIGDGTATAMAPNNFNIAQLFN